MLTPILLLGKKDIPAVLPEEFVARVEFKRFPETPELLAELIETHYCVIDVDTLSPDDKKMAMNKTIANGRPFWLYSREAGAVIQLDDTNGLLVLASSER
ncbi:TPA: hypothetical protein DCR79_01835 [Patescibacteria group bacterium]|nr:hypothetical protein [Patescibacteria group bacterium]HCR41933.1 hypothetical protein [Patescibacteria group bacterium]